ncbi:reverse transcriptase domain-containing protein [Tanacetum coccineum]
MKQLIAELPMLTAPMEKEELIVYLAASKETVTAVLMTEREAKQMPIYFVSKALRGPKLNYTSMEKSVLTLVHASKRLKRYFQAYPIIVIMDQPIQQILSRPKLAGRLQKWSIELGEYVIHYRPRVLVKGQVLVDFIVEQPEEDSPDTMIEVEEELPKLWILFDATNNEAKYEALIAGLRIVKQMGVKNLQANMDSLKTLTSSFKAFSIRQILRSEQVLVEELKENSISEVEILAVIEEEGDTWMTPIFKYLAEETLPVDVKKARAIRRKSWRSATNRLVERANRSLGEGIKAKLDARSKNWMEEFPHVLWAHRTMIKSSNEDTPFSLTYETEAVIPAEIGMPTLRTAEVNLVQNNEALEINLDLLEERREEAAIREAKSKVKIEKYYNAKVQNTSFNPGDLVYRKNDVTQAEDTGKLGPK